ncbi:MAG: pyridoxal phosphate-dependent aminotransferase, partial [Deltaproteobacteria bacterium]|nr:pyridoxal phosphate-dependent aminotransferase [Deltaproteobacteria bacterium]
MLTNHMTDVKGRVASSKEISVEERNELVALAQKKLDDNPEIYHWTANIHGIAIKLHTNSYHLYDFWVENWFAGPRTHTILPHGLIYAVNGVEGHEPHAYYNHETRTAIFINTEYYGQCKSWALGIAADILETQHDMHSIHGSCAVVYGKGIVIIAPTGTGKSTHTWGLMQLPDGKIHSDDWIFVRYKKGIALADISERKFYLRTDMVKDFPNLEPLLRRSKCENVENDDFTSFGNS